MDRRVGVLKVVRDDGVVLDATFSVFNDPLSIVFESAGGKIGVNARNRADREERDRPGTYLARVRDGKVVEFNSYSDIAGMMMQLGFMPEM